MPAVKPREGKINPGHRDKVVSFVYETCLLCWFCGLFQTYDISPDAAFCRLHLPLWPFHLLSPVRLPHRVPVLVFLGASAVLLLHVNIPIVHILPMLLWGNAQGPSTDVLFLSRPASSSSPIDKCKSQPSHLCFRATSLNRQFVEGVRGQ